MPFKQGNSDSVIADTRSSRFLKAVSYVVIVVFMANLNAIVDSFVHDQIPYFDQEHLIVGAITGLVSALLFGALFLYSDRLKKVVAAKQADGEKLARSEKTYREVFESSKDVIFIQAHDGRFIDLNPAALEVFGYATRQEMVALDVPHDFYAYPEDWITRQKAMERNGYVENFEVEMVRKDGERIFVQETATAALDEQGRIVGYRGTMRDITQQRQLEAQLGQAQKMESIGRLAGGLSHDFNNYLTTISGHVEIAARSLEPDSPVRDSLREINNSVDKASGLIRQLRLFSRSQPINLEPVDINGIIWETKDMLARMMDRVTVSFQPANGLAAVEADRANIEQALLNLALNARKNMPQGGELDILTKMVTIDESYALIHAEAYPGSFVRITIRDTGIGMDVEEIAHVFEPFYRERHDGGEGLGLAVAYGIVMQHGGWIEVESSSGHGSSFSIYLPASSREAASLPGASGTDGLQGHGERILLVEDEEAVRATIERMLRDNGYIVLTAADAEQAYDIFVSHAGNIHLVFSDVVLPGESGVELVEQLRLHKNGLPVILSSGYTDRDQDLDTIRKRDYRFLQKPFSLPDLLKTVREVMDPVSMS